jgi:hypothetical protein
MRVFSFRDLKIIPQLSHMTERDMLKLENDEVILPILEELGFDIRYPILYVPSKHRDLQGKVGVGYRACGTITTNREFLNSHLCEPIDRVIATAQYDMSLTEQLSQLMGTSSIDFSQSVSSMDYGEDNVLADDDVEPDYEEIELQLRMLEMIRDEIRGNPYREDGALKTPEDYHVVA